MPVIAFELDTARHTIVVSRVPCAGEHIAFDGGTYAVRTVTHTPCASPVDAAIDLERVEPTP